MYSYECFLGLWITGYIWLQPDENNEQKEYLKGPKTKDINSTEHLITYPNISPNNYIRSFRKQQKSPLNRTRRFSSRIEHLINRMNLVQSDDFLSHQLNKGSIITISWNRPIGHSRYDSGLGLPHLHSNNRTRILVPISPGLGEDALSDFSFSICHKLWFYLQSWRWAVYTVRACTHVCVCVYTCTYMCMHVLLYVSISIYYIHVYIYTSLERLRDM